MWGFFKRWMVGEFLSGEEMSGCLLEKRFFFRRGYVYQIRELEAPSQLRMVKDRQEG